MPLRRVIYGKPFLLLPDVVLMLTAQGTDEGSASVSLPITSEGEPARSSSLGSRIRLRQLFPEWQSRRARQCTTAT